MTKEDILNNFKFDGKYAEQLKGQFVTIDNEKIPLEKFAKSFYESGLKRSLEEEVKKYIDWQKDNFEEDKLNINYYVVLSLLSNEPILCILSNGTFKSLSSGRLIMPDEVVIAKKIEVPQEEIEYVNNYIQANKEKILSKSIADEIVYGTNVNNFAKLIIQQANIKNIDIQELINTLEYNI